MKRVLEIRRMRILEGVVTILHHVQNSLRTRLLERNNLSGGQRENSLH